MRKLSGPRKYTKEALEDAVAKSLSVSDVCRVFGKQPQGAVYQHIRRAIKRFNLSTVHWLGYAAKAGKRNPNYTSPRTKLHSGHRQRVRGEQLRRALIELGISEVCSVCGLREWQGQFIRLHVDHIDGDWSNCAETNLRFLCPNCHSQTRTYGWKGQRASRVIQRIPEEDKNSVQLGG